LKYNDLELFARPI